MSKRGQFYIIAAALIIAVLAGLATVENRATVSSNSAVFYDMGDNFGKESVRIVDSGVYNKESQGDIEKKIYDFYENYTRYSVAKDPYSSISFVYGDRSRAIIGTLNTAQASTDIFGLDNSSNGVSSGTKIISYPSRQSFSGNNVTVRIGDQTKEFDLKDKESFYFIMVSVKDKEVLVSQNA